MGDYTPNTKYKHEEKAPEAPKAEVKAEEVAETPVPAVSKQATVKKASKKKA